MQSVDVNSIRHESKIVGDIYIYRLNYGSFQMGDAYSIDQRSLQFTHEWSGMAANISSEGICEWSEPQTAVIDQRR